MENFHAGMCQQAVAGGNWMIQHTHTHMRTPLPCRWNTFSPLPSAAWAQTKRLCRGSWVILRVGKQTKTSGLLEPSLTARKQPWPRWGDTSHWLGCSVGREPFPRAVWDLGEPLPSWDPLPPGLLRFAVGRSPKAHTWRFWDVVGWETWACWAS